MPSACLGPSRWISSAGKRMRASPGSTGKGGSPDTRMLKQNTMQTPVTSEVAANRREAIASRNVVYTTQPIRRSNVGEFMGFPWSRLRLSVRGTLSRKRWSCLGFTESGRSARRFA